MSTRRRSNGDGSIYWRASDGRWLAVMTVGRRPDGTPIKRTRVAKTRSEARRRLRELQDEFDEGPLLSDEKITVADWCHHWCDTIAPQNASPPTLADYRWTLDHYVLPHLGHYRVRDLAPRHIAAFQNALIGRGLAKKTVRHARGPLSSALNHAVRVSMIRVNPCNVIRQPRRDATTEKTKTSLTLEEARRLLDAASQAEAALWAFIAFGVYRGPRQGEILGLRWADIDAEAEVIHVRQRLREERTRSADGVYLMELRAGKTKTRKSQRDLSLRGVVGTAVKTLRADQAKRRLAAGTDWVDSGYLFTNAVGKPLRPANMYRRYKKLLADHDLPNISFHDLRRTWGTLSQEADIRIEQAQEALGHSRIETTKNIYVNAVPILAQRAFDTFDDYLDAPHRPATRRAHNTEET